MGVRGGMRAVGERGREGVGERGHEGGGDRVDGLRDDSECSICSLSISTR